MPHKQHRFRSKFLPSQDPLKRKLNKSWASSNFVFTGAVCLCSWQHTVVQLRVKYDLECALLFVFTCREC